MQTHNKKLLSIQSLHWPTWRVLIVQLVESNGWSSRVARKLVFRSLITRTWSQTSKKKKTRTCWWLKYDYTLLLSAIGVIIFEFVLVNNQPSVTKSSSFSLIQFRYSSLNTSTIFSHIITWENIQGEPNVPKRCGDIESGMQI